MYHLQVLYKHSVNISYKKPKTLISATACYR